ncbi:MAG: homoserine/homoserine lactone efflux protein [Candidatus Accumulibacter sp.]|jgi:homoserine/homoserine lactone efflux protein|nr:homoserine/homoserine lactone efflux protein [Accumulibacter sp.]
MALSVWLGFLVASILIAISPGPGAAVSMSTGMRYGFVPALRAIAGLQCALLCQLGVVAAGLGAILSASTSAFNVVRFAGSAYLIWLGVQKWREAPRKLDEDEPTARRSLFFQGIFVNLSNPKAIVFIAALTPQFVDPGRAQALQFLIIALTMCGVDVVVMSCYALLAARMGRWLRDARALKTQSRFFGGVFVCAGIWLAAAGRN